MREQIQKMIAEFSKSTGERLSHEDAIRILNIILELEAKLENIHN
jgi:hypothetical protein